MGKVKPVAVMAGVVSGLAAAVVGLGVIPAVVVGGVAAVVAQKKLGTTVKK